MEGYMMENGLKIKCMGKENIHGKMVDAIKANIFMTRSMALGFTFGLMGEDMKGIGKMAKGKGGENIFCQMDHLGKEYGTKIKE